MQNSKTAVILGHLWVGDRRVAGACFLWGVILEHPPHLKSMDVVLLKKIPNPQLLPGHALDHGLHGYAWIWVYAPQCV